jgi:uncharacterized membrane protein YvlD (DUF360 family)
MNYLKSLSINFLVVFFADHILPGIEVTHTKLPHIGGDLILALILALLNSLIYPTLKLIKSHVSALKIALIAFILNFATYGIAKMLPIGLTLTSVEGYILVSTIVTLGSFITNYLELKRHSHHPTDLPP